MGTKINDIPIVLHTMDSYSKFWNPWYYFFKKHVTNHGPIYFLSEEKEPDFVNEVIHIKTGKGEWGERLLKGLKEVDSELIFYMQEDFWSCKDFNLDKNFITLFNKYDMDALRLSFNSSLYDLTHINDNLYQYKQKSQYTMSHQFTLWKKDFLLKYVLPHENPWENEMKASLRINCNNHRIYLFECDFYIPSVNKGEINEDGIELLKKYNL